MLFGIGKQILRFEPADQICDVLLGLLLLNNIMKIFLFQCLSLFRRNLRPQDKDKLISMVPDLYKAVQMEPMEGSPLNAR